MSDGFFGLSFSASGIRRSRPLKKTSGKRPHSESLGIHFFIIIWTVCFPPVAYGAVEVWAYALTEGIVWTGILIFLTGRIRKGRIPVRRTPVDLPTAGFLLISLASLFYSVYPYISRIYGIKLLSYAFLFYYMVHTLRRSRQILLLITVISVFGGLYATAGLAAFSSELFGFQNFSEGAYNISLTFPNHSHFAGFLEMPVWLCVGLAAASGGAKGRLLIFLAAYMALAILFSLSRGGIIGFFFGLVFFGLLYSVFQRRRKRKPSFIILPFFVLIFSFGGWFGLEPVMNRMETLKNPLIAGRGRLVIWSDTLNMISERPVSGYGLGTFPFAYPAFQSDDFAHRFMNHAHNDYLEAAAELGWPGLVLALSGAVMLFGASIRRILYPPHESPSYGAGPHGPFPSVCIGALAGCFSLLVHAATDFNFHIPSNAVMFSACAALAVLASEKAEKNSHGRNRGDKEERREVILTPSRTVLAGLFLALFSAALCFGIVTPYIGQRFMEKARTDHRGGRDDSAVRRLRLAERIDPGNADYAAFLGDIYELQAEREPDNGRKENLLNEAGEHYARAASACPTRGYYYTKMARIHEKTGRYREAEEKYTRAAALTPSDPYVFYDLGHFLLKNGDIEASLPYYQSYIQKDEANFIWALHDLREVMRDDLRLKDLIPRTASFRRKFASFLAEKGETASASEEWRLAFSLEPSAENALAHIRGLSRIRADEEASDVAEFYLKRFENHPALMKELAGIYGRLKKNESARRLYEQLLIRKPNDPEIRLAFADFCLKSGKPEKAVSLLKDGIVRYPDSVVIYIRISGIYLKEKKYSEAVRILKAGLNVRKNDRRLLERLAVSHETAGELGDAVGIRKKIILLHPDDMKNRHRLGKLYRKMGLFQNAVDEWDRCRRLDSEYAPCKEAAEKMRREMGLM